MKSKIMPKNTFCLPLLFNADIPQLYNLKELNISNKVYLNYIVNLKHITVNSIKST